MAHSIQMLGQKSAIFSDATLVIIMILARDVISQHPHYFELAALSETWRLAVIQSGPGTIDLKIEELIKTPEMKEKFGALLERLHEEVGRFGEKIPASFLNERAPIPNDYTFIDVKVSTIQEALSKLKNLA